MGFELGEKRSIWEYLMTPSVLLTLVGIVILAISVFFFATASPGGDDVDAILQAQSQSGSRLKSMIGLVVGSLVSIAGVLWSLMTFSRR